MIATAAAWFGTPSRLNARVLCCSTVFGLMPSTRAICLPAIPFEARRRTWSSRVRQVGAARDPRPDARCKGGREMVDRRVHCHDDAALIVVRERPPDHHDAESAFAQSSHRS